MSKQVIFLLSVFAFAIVQIGKAQQMHPRYTIKPASSRVTDLASDAQGFVYASLHGRIGTTLPQLPGQVSTGNAGVAKFDTLGNVLWSVGFVSTNAVANGIALDTQGNIVLAGQEKSGTFVVDMLVVKLKPDGTKLWERRVGNGEENRVTGVDVGPDGTIYVTGGFKRTVNFGSGPISSSNFKLNPFLWAIKPDGTTAWVTKVNSYLDGTSYAISVGKDNSPVIVGYMSIQGVSPSVTFIHKYNAFGSVVFQKTLHSPDHRFAFGVKVATDTSVHIVGEFRGKVDFDPGSDSVFLQGGQGDAFCLKLDPLGNFKWAVKAGSGSSYDAAYGIDVDTEGQVYIAGNFGYTVDFDPGPGVFNMTATTQFQNLFLLKLTSEAGFIHAVKYGSTNSDHDLGLAVKAVHPSYVVTGGKDWGGPYVGIVSGYGSCPVKAAYSDVGFCQGGWLPDSSYYVTKSGSITTQVGLASNGCDSLHVLNVSIQTTMPNITITNIGDTLRIDDGPYAVVWLDCNNNYTAITDTVYDDFYVPPVSGTYAASIGFGLCTDTTACVSVILSSGTHTEQAETLQIFPTVATSVLYLGFSHANALNDGQLNFELIDRLGRKHQAKATAINGGFQLEISNLEAGVYWVRLKHSGNSYVGKFVKGE